MTDKPTRSAKAFSLPTSMTELIERRACDERRTQSAIVEDMLRRVLAAEQCGGSPRQYLAILDGQDRDLIDAALRQVEALDGSVCESEVA